MAITKIKTLVGKIDCPNCLSLIQWTDSKDLGLMNGNTFVECPVCGQKIILDENTDYWMEQGGSGGGNNPEWKPLP